jgi:DNA-3-methyladenine glycosylase II
MGAMTRPRSAPVMLSRALLADAARRLARRDRHLGRIHRELGPPPLWSRRPGFPTLIHIILEQQVSLASARAAFDRLREAAAPLTPETFLDLDDAALKVAGFSRQKTRYGRELARAVREDRLDLGALRRLDDQAVREELTRVKGIGRWTADIYLLMVLKRPDIWPRGDLALAAAARQVKALPASPSDRELEAMAEAWRPWRAVAARMLWQHYLTRPRRVSAPAGP